MAISRSQQPRQNYGLGSFVKKAFNKVTKPFTKVAQKIVPKEIAGIAQIAAPFLGPVAGPLAFAAGQAKQKGRINPFALAATALPYTKFGGSTADSMTGLSRFMPSGYGSMGEGQGLRQLLFQGYEVPKYTLEDGSKFRQKGLLGDKYGTRADEFLFGSPAKTKQVEREGLFPDLGGRETVLVDELQPAKKGILGIGGKFDLIDSKVADLAIRKKDGKTLSPLKIGTWGMSIYSGIEANKYKDEMEAAEAAEEALLAADATATEADIAEAREWAQTVFGRLSRADIGLAQGGRVNYAMGTGPVLPPDPTKPVNPFAPKPTGPVLPNKEMAMSYGYDDAMSDTYSLFLQMKDRKEIPIDMDFDEFLMEVVPEMSKKQTMEDKPMAANGGLMRSNYALGTKPEPKESGLGGLPIEADMRYSGGFMPYGKKEKADDVPARLSKNEFVFTADAVRAAGGGSMNEGARKMYQTMKMLEQQNRMMS